MGSVLNIGVTLTLFMRRLFALLLRKKISYDLFEDWVYPLPFSLPTSLYTWDFSWFSLLLLSSSSSDDKYLELPPRRGLIVRSQRRMGPDLSRLPFWV